MRVALVALALLYVLPGVAGVSLHGDLWGALMASLVFNAVFRGIECLLKVIVFGINVGTLGVFLTASLKFLAALLSPSIALIGTSMVLPGYLHIGNYFPGAICAGLALGGTLWVSLPATRQASRKKEAG